MIISERAVQRRIKRANTDWWINEKAVVGKNGKTYIAYFNDTPATQPRPGQLSRKTRKRKSTKIRIRTTKTPARSISISIS